jgi:hypothetical protein
MLEVMCNGFYISPPPYCVRESFGICATVHSNTLTRIFFLETIGVLVFYQMY